MELQMRMICFAQEVIYILLGNLNLPPCAVRCCHDPFFVEQCATTEDFNFIWDARDGDVAARICAGKTDLPTDLALNSILAANDSVNPIFR